MYLLHIFRANFRRQGIGNDRNFFKFRTNAGGVHTLVKLKIVS